MKILNPLLLLLKLFLALYLGTIYDVRSSSVDRNGSTGIMCFPVLRV